MNDDDDDDPPIDPARFADDATSLVARDLVTLGGLLVAGVVLGLGAGALLDSWADTSPLFVLLGIAAGIVVAGIGFWLRVRTFLRA
jgi:F0F1-type ATP synthase assembly protein I